VELTDSEAHDVLCQFYIVALLIEQRVSANCANHNRRRIEIRLNESIEPATHNVLIFAVIVVVLLQQTNSTCITIPTMHQHSAIEIRKLCHY